MNRPRLRAQAQGNSKQDALKTVQRVVREKKKKKNIGRWSGNFV